MKRKIKLLGTFMIPLLIIFLALNVSGHSGGTDGNGGHYDSSTGEYHYHHGYSAHDHYDMDGDGTLDCPYNFKDNTSYNFSSSSSSGTTKSSKSSYTDVQIKTITETEYIYVEEFPTWAIWSGLALGFSVLGLWMSNRSKAKEIKELTSEHKKETDKLRGKIARMGKWIRKEVLRRQYLADEEPTRVHYYPPDTKVNHHEPDPFSLFQDFNNDKDPFSLPTGVRIQKDGFLSYGETSDKYPYGKYTVFITYSGECYHSTPNCRSLNYMVPVNIMSVLDSKRPCGLCCFRFKKNPSVPQWYKNFVQASNDMEIKW